MARASNTKFRHTVVLPPFLAKAFIRSQSSDPAELGLVTVSATNSFLEMVKDDSSFDKQLIEETGYYIACFLWGIANEHISNSASSLAVHQSVAAWAEEIQLRFISPRSATPADPAEITPPSNTTLASLANNIA